MAKKLTTTEAVYNALKGGETLVTRALAFATLVAEAGGDVNGKVKDLPAEFLADANAACTKRFLELHKTETYLVSCTVKGGKKKYSARKCHADAEGAVEFDVAVAVGMETLKECEPERKAGLVAIRKEHSDYVRVSLGDLMKRGAKTLAKQEREDAERDGEETEGGRGAAKTYRTKVEVLLDKLVTLAHKSKADATCPDHARLTSAFLKVNYIREMFNEGGLDEEVPQG